MRARVSVPSTLVTMMVIALLTALGVATTIGGRVTARTSMGEITHCACGEGHVEDIVWRDRAASRRAVGITLRISLWHTCTTPL